MNNFVLRTITGSVLVIIITVAVLFSSLSYIALMLIITGLLMNEFYRIIRVRLNRPNVPLGIGIGILIFLVTILYSVKVAPPELAALFIPMIMMVFVNELYRKQKNPMANVGLTFLGLIYIALPFALMNFMVFEGVAKNPEIETSDVSVGYANEFLNYLLFIKPDVNIVYNPYFLLALFIIIWVYDSVAYIIGVNFGKHTLFRSVSPKKSWEGFIGGVVFTPLTAFLLYKFIGNLTLSQWIIYSLIIVVFSTFGDLVESLFKRSIQIKDSGRSLPGHGGFLDRFDSVLMAAPMAYLYLELIK